MKKNKFDLGEKVFFMEDDSVKNEAIEGIFRANGEAVYTFIMEAHLKQFAVKIFSEDKLFKTKEELINTL